jgi:hypothetical protein
MTGSASVWNYRMDGVTCGTRIDFRRVLNYIHMYANALEDINLVFETNIKYKKPFMCTLSDILM